MTKQEKIEIATGHKSVDHALLAAQPNFKKAEKDAENTHFKTKYSTFSAVLDATLPALHAQGILLSQPMECGEFGNFIVTELIHPESNTKKETKVPLLLGKQDMQALKSASTYAKRIGFENLTGAASGDDDDAEIERESNSFGAGLKDAWEQGVLDSIPEGATPQQRAKAFADAICADFEGKGEKALKNRWNKFKRFIDPMESRFKELHGQVVDAYENAMMAATDNDTGSMI